MTHVDHGMPHGAGKAEMRTTAFLAGGLASFCLRTSVVLGGCPRCPSFETLRPRRVAPVHISLKASVARGWARTRDMKLVRNAFQSEHLPGVRFETPPHLTAHDLLSMAKGESPDAWINEVLRALLGWTVDDDGEWDATFVAQEWAEAYPDGPPDFIGSAADYSPATDRPIKKAVQKLTRSIPREHKQILRDVLGPLGFPGWKIDQLTPNRTRRATAVNWILYYYHVHWPDYEWRTDS